MQMTWPARPLAILLLMVVVVALPAASQRRDHGDRPNRGGQRGQGERGPGRGSDQVVYPPDVAALNKLSVIIGRPTDKSATLNIISEETIEWFVEFGAAGKISRKTAVLTLAAREPAEVTLEDLAPATNYSYRVNYRKPGETKYRSMEEHSFVTQRSPGQSFLFEIQGDSHPERRHQFDSELYAQTLRAAAADKPDFYMTIGDDFSVDTLREVTPQTVEQRYRLQRPFLALVGQSAAIFLVNGNHEQAAAANLDGTQNNVAVWAQKARNKVFPMPAPDGFYSGDAARVEPIGFLRDYYAWTWGDALFVVIDPYWHSSKPVDNVFGGGEKTRDRWSITLGDEQYRWLKKTLETSKAKYKFVFTHHVLGTGRGGIEQAGEFEWGGNDRRGDSRFAQQRPGWELPIHKLMAKNGVTIFFQGHDHVFAHQVLDGVVYQTLPEPADPNYALYNETAYRSGDILPNSGRVRVRVSPEKVTVEYLRSYLPKDVSATQVDNGVAFSYEIKGRK